METKVQKQISDLERIQQSYTSGGQDYVPSKDKATPSPTQQQAYDESTRGLQCPPLCR